jgi:hypothetical protein
MSTGRMQYFAVGDPDSGLVVHVEREDGYANCGTRPKSPHKGWDWWYDTNRQQWRQVVPQPTVKPVTCLRKGCLG